MLGVKKQRICAFVCAFSENDPIIDFSPPLLLSQAITTDTQNQSVKEKGNVLNELKHEKLSSHFSTQTGRKKAKSRINIGSK